MVNFTLNEDRCIKCGKCVDDCPPSCIVMEDNAFPTVPDEDKCIRCQHCLAICPTGAVSIMGCNPDDSLKLDYSLPTARSMETLIKGRRATRNYKKQGVDPATIRHLLETAWHAPTGVNAQGVLLTATVTPEATEGLRQEIYARLDDLIPTLDPDADGLAEAYMRMSHTGYREHGNDVVLRGAPHIVIASAPKTAPTPEVDGVIALTNFELLAQSQGVGTVWNGILKWCLTGFFPDLLTRLGVPEDHTVSYAMAFGHPAIRYHRTVQRIPEKMNLLKTF